MLTEICLLCGSSLAQVLFECKDRLKPTDDIFQAVRCLQCSLVYTRPNITEEELATYYPKTSYKVTGSDTIKQIGNFELKFAWFYSRLLWKSLAADKPKALIAKVKLIITDVVCFPLFRYLRRYFPFQNYPGRFLDIGCGSGKLLMEQKRLGWDVYGVELEETMAAYARQKRNLNVTSGLFENASYQNEFFDLVNLNHVLEHFINPVGNLKKISKILKLDGILIFRIPNHNRIGATLFGRLWFPYQIPRHRFHFNSNTIQKILLRGDFKPIRVIHTLEINSLIMSLRYLFEDKKLSKTIIQWFNIENKLLRWLFLPLSLLLKIMGQSGEILVYAQKKKP